MTGEKVTTILNLSCVYAILWGIFVVYPGTNTFAISPDLYAPMAQIIPSEVFWGILMIVIGTAALVVQGSKASLTMTLTFLGFATLFFLGDFERPAWALFGTLAVFNFLQWRAATWTINSPG